MNNKLDRMQETSKYYNVLLKIFSNINSNYILTEEEKELFKDDELLDKFIEDLTGMTILIQTENRSNQEPDESMFNSLFKIESSTFDSIKEKMKQIRNCFAHSRTKKIGEKIKFDNGKIKGEISINQIAFLPMIYTLKDIEEAKEAFSEMCQIEINKEELEEDNKLKNIFLKLAMLEETKILAGNIIPGKINNKEDLEKLFKMGKVVKFLDKSTKNNAKNYMKFRFILDLIDWKNMSPTQLTKIMKKQIGGNENFRVKALREYSEVIRAYIDYIGEDTFYKLGFQLQRDIIEEAVTIKEKEGKDRIIKLEKLLLNIMDIKSIAEEDISKINCNVENPKNLMELICNRYTNVFMYENVMYTYIYSRLIYLKEMLNTNQIDDSVLNYSEIDIGDIDFEYTFTKKDIQKRKDEINISLINIRKLCEEQKVKKNVLEKKLNKNDNPKNPKRDEIVREYTNKINKVNELIIQYENQKKKLEEEEIYINTNNTIPVSPNMIFRTLRNRATHGFKISLFSRMKALKNQNLGDLSFEFEESEDKGSKALVSMTATRLIKLITDIENNVISNINKINEMYNPLDDAIEETKKDIGIGEINEIANKVAEEKKFKIKSEEKVTKV